MIYLAENETHTNGPQYYGTSGTFTKRGKIDYEKMRYDFEKIIGAVHRWIIREGVWIKMVAYYQKVIIWNSAKWIVLFFKVYLSGYKYDFNRGRHFDRKLRQDCLNA
jgi:hypothetical protein